MAKLLSSTLLLAALAAPSSAQPRIPGPGAAWVQEDQRDEIKETLAELAKKIKDKKGGGDAEAIEVIDGLLGEFPACGPKDRAAIVKGLESCLKAKRSVELEPGVPDSRLHLAAAVALQNMAPESVKVLIDQVGNKNHQKVPAVIRALILSLGKTRDTSGVKTLLGLLDHKEAQIQASASEALGEFSGAELKLRKDIFEDLLKLMMGRKNEMDADPTDNIARDRWNVLSGPIIASLQSLSGYDERDPQAWQRWWNKNKKTDWDEQG